MTGPKLNEKNREAGSKSGTLARARYVRMSASKARVVLNLIRDQEVMRADEILKFTDREAARVIRKVLASAVANAVNNDELDADDLYVKACYADEGPTLKRFTPRARGRAGSILYDMTASTVTLREDAWLSDDGRSEIRGDPLVYNVRDQRVQAGKPAGSDERVRIIIRPRTTP